MAVSRTERRSGFQDEHRIRLLESDVDDIAAAVDQLRRDLTAEIEKLRGTLSGLRNALIGALAALAASSILLGLNLAIGG